MGGVLTMKSEAYSRSVLPRTLEALAAVVLLGLFIYPNLAFVLFPVCIAFYWTDRYLSSLPIWVRIVIIIVGSFLLFTLRVQVQIQ